MLFPIFLFSSFVLFDLVGWYGFVCGLVWWCIWFWIGFWDLVAGWFGFVVCFVLLLGLRLWV